MKKVFTNKIIISVNIFRRMLRLGVERFTIKYLMNAK
jgi:hypothetical protein